MDFLGNLDGKFFTTIETIDYISLWITWVTLAVKNRVVNSSTL